MKIGFIADIVGKPGRSMVKHHLPKVKKEYGLDLVIVNGENASHGSGLVPKNAKELFDSGADVITGGNHTWGKKEILALFESEPVIRPINYPEGVPGEGKIVLEIGGERVAVINLMGYFTMPPVENPFIYIKREIESLHKEGIKKIIIDFHAEATSEKRALMHMLKSKVSAILGSHTHVGTDDLTIEMGTCYVSDVGLTGCRDNVIGVKSEGVIHRFLTGLPYPRFDVPDKCKKIFQMIIFELDENGCKDAFKIKAYDFEDPFISQKAFFEK
ncbi:MAG: YmdB family metallophosphoesterase [Epsilonproteobacteria bacterium]|nr:YmdB family metallophosphoesterase [Campylobacterota bacterium]